MQCFVLYPRGEDAKERFGWRAWDWLQPPLKGTARRKICLMQPWPTNGFHWVGFFPFVNLSNGDVDLKKTGKNEWVNLEWTLQFNFGSDSWLHNMVYMNHKAGFPRPSPWSCSCSKKTWNKCWAAVTLLFVRYHAVLLLESKVLHENVAKLCRKQTSFGQLGFFFTLAWCNY